MLAGIQQAHCECWVEIPRPPTSWPQLIRTGCRSRATLRRDPAQQIPNYVAINPVDRYDSFQIAGPAYLGPSYEPFKVTGDPDAPEFSVPNVGLKDEAAHSPPQRTQRTETQN